MPSMMIGFRLWLVVASAVLAWLATGQSVNAANPSPCDGPAFGTATASSQGVSPEKLFGLAQWVRDTPVPIFSLAMSRHGKVVFLLTTGGIGPDDAHYLMSVTKSVVSALVGAAIDRGLIRSAEMPVLAALPARYGADSDRRKRFEHVTVRDVLGMSALDAQVTPHEKTPAAHDRSLRFMGAADRLEFALGQRVLPRPGTDFQYTDITPAIAVGIVQHASQRTMLDFAKIALFDPMDFRNEEWMHQDPSGYDNGGYGLRLRPVDMQKFGILYLARGCWAGHRLLSESWVATSLTPWISSHGPGREPDYGWYWWRNRFADGSIAHVANGWKGQRIAVFPRQDVVVTMTALAEDSTSDRLFATVIDRFVLPAVTEPALDAERSRRFEAQIATALREIQHQPSRVPAGAENRMIPSASPKERRRDFVP